MLKNFSLNIAGYNIGLESAPDGPGLIPGERFLGSLAEENIAPDVHIRVHSGVYKLPSDAERVFHAPLYEEINGISRKKSDNFWSIYKHRNELLVEIELPYTGLAKKGCLKLSLNSGIWDLYLNSKGHEVDPLEYPIDSLVLYYLTVKNGDIMLHGSGVKHARYGYVFSGVSGKGKTTIAKLWANSGATVIHDDRLIIRRAKDGFRMFNTPVYRNDTPSSSGINRIYIIEHGKENRVEPLRGANAVSLVLANCIQHNWNSEIVARLMGAVSIMCTTIPVFKLYFKPDRSVIDFLLDYE